MPFRQVLVVSFLSAVEILVVLELARRRRLKEEYALLWLAGGLLGLACALWYRGLLLLSSLVGIVIPTSTVFFLALLALGFISLHFAVRVSDLSEKVQRLAQEIALLKGEGGAGRGRQAHRALAGRPREKP